MPNSHLSLTQYMFLSPAKVHGTFTVCLSEATAVFGLEIPISQKPPPEGWDSKHVLIHSPLPLKFRSNLLAPGAKMKASGLGCTCGITLVLLSLLAVLHATTAQKVTGVHGCLSGSGVS